MAQKKTSSNAILNSLEKTNSTLMTFSVCSLEEVELTSSLEEGQDTNADITIIMVIKEDMKLEHNKSKGTLASDYYNNYFLCY